MSTYHPHPSHATQKFYKEADPLYREAISIGEEILPGHPLLAEWLHNLARLLEAQARKYHGREVWGPTLVKCVTRGCYDTAIH